MLAARLEGVLEASGRRGLDEEGALQRVADGPGDADARSRALDRLVAEGRVIEYRGRFYAPRFTEWQVGTVQALARGDALLITGDGGEPGYFVRARNLNGALDRDLVLARPLRRERHGRGRRLPEATISRILTARAKILVGRLESDRGGSRLVPFDPRERLEVVVAGKPPVGERDYVVVELDRRPRADGRLAAKVVEVLGDPEEPGVDVEVVLRHFGIPEPFPDAVLAAADRFPEDPGEAEWQGREDLRDQVIVTIDGASARDFDDAITVERTARGGFRLGVHIADVSHYVREGSPLDLEAYRRGTSVYYPERAIPMLPERLSNGLCSLRPDVPRLTMSAFLDLDGNGEVRRRRFATTIIRSHRRLTYDEVRRMLEEPEPGDEAQYGAVLPMLRQAEELAKLLNRRRVERGSLDFDLPEGDVVLDSDGTMVGVLPGERHIAHRMIEEFMIAANEAVAQEVDGHECPALYRIHEPPDPERLEELRELLRTFGIRLPEELESLHPSALQEALERVEGRPEEALVSTLVLRSMQRAVYSPECRGHYALASRYYCHFTSPIRRYPDLLVHRQLKRVLAGTWREDSERDLLAERLPAMAQQTSDTERRAERSERELLQWKKVRHLAPRVGERFSGQITGVQPFGLFVQLSEYLVDGLVPVDSMSDDYYVYEPEQHHLLGEHTGRRFRLGDPVDVVMTGVNERQRGLVLALASLDSE